MGGGLMQLASLWRQGYLPNREPSRSLFSKLLIADILTFPYRALSKPGVGNIMIMVDALLYFPEMEI